MAAGEDVEGVEVGQLHQALQRSLDAEGYGEIIPFSAKRAALH
jgi:hypothetical protein